MMLIFNIVSCIMAPFLNQPYFQAPKLMYARVRIAKPLHFWIYWIFYLLKLRFAWERRRDASLAFYNTPEHDHHFLPGLPLMHHYCPDRMFRDRRTESLERYETHRNDPFDFQKEIREYYTNYVDILLSAYCKFRQLIKVEIGVKEAVQNSHYLV